MQKKKSIKYKDYINSFNFQAFFAKIPALFNVHAFFAKILVFFSAISKLKEITWKSVRK